MIAPGDRYSYHKVLIKLWKSKVQWVYNHDIIYSTFTTYKVVRYVCKMVLNQTTFNSSWKKNIKGFSLILQRKKNFLQRFQLEITHISLVNCAFILCPLEFPLKQGPSCRGNPILASSWVYKDMFTWGISFRQCIISCIWVNVDITLTVTSLINPNWHSKVRLLHCHQA